MTICKFCLWDIRQDASGTWVLAWAGVDDDVPDAAQCDGPPDGRHAPAEPEGEK